MSSNTKWKRKPVDWTTRELMDLIPRINLNPIYQRELVWVKSDKQKLILSMLDDFAIPQLFVHLQYDGVETVYDVIDGQQRIDAVIAYSQNEFELPSDSILYTGEDVSGFKCKNLPLDLQRRFLGYTFNIQQIECNDEDMVIDQFLRTQRGKRLTNQQKREAYPTTISLLVKKMAAHPMFSHFHISKRKDSKRVVAAKILIWEYHDRIFNVMTKSMNAFYIKKGTLLEDDVRLVTAYESFIQTADKMMESFPNGYNEKTRNSTMILCLYWAFRNLGDHIDGVDLTLWVDSFFNELPDLLNVDIKYANRQFFAMGTLVEQNNFRVDLITQSLNEWVSKNDEQLVYSDNLVKA